MKRPYSIAMDASVFHAIVMSTAEAVTSSVQSLNPGRKSAQARMTIVRNNPLNQGLSRSNV